MPILRRLHRIRLVCAVGLIAAACGMAAGAGSYETSFEEGTGTPRGWHPPGNAEEWTWATEGHTGNRSICLIGHSDETGYAGWRSDPVPVEPNCIYRLTFWYKSEHEEKLRGCGMGPEDVRIAFPYSAEWHKGEIVFWTPHHRQAVTFTFSIYHMKGKAWLDDVSLESMAASYLERDGLTLSGFEKIEKGTYVFDWGFNATTTNVCRLATRNTSNFMDNRIRLTTGKEVILRFELGRYEQRSGRLLSRLSYYIDGEAVWSASRDGKTWSEIGRMSDREGIKQSGKKFDFVVPRALYPAKELFVKVVSTGQLQINQVRYEAVLSGSPPDMVGRTEFFLGQLISVRNGPLQLRFDQSTSSLARIERGSRVVGRLTCKVAQFEKEGMGYKGTGVACSSALRITSIELKKRDPAECVVEVSAERVQSQPCRRRFEARYQIVLIAGQPWLKSTLLSVKNTDTVAYTLKGYFHQLAPAEPDAVPVCFATIAGWVSPASLLGAAMDRTEPFTLAFRKVGGVMRGDITRRLDVKLEPGMTWEKGEPSVVIFALPGGDEEALYRQAYGLMRRTAKPSADIADGVLEYDEREQK